MTKSVFVTGASGFIGRALIAHLSASSEFQLKILVRGGAQVEVNDGSVETIVGDLLKPSSYEAALAGTETIVHLAAATSITAPEVFQQINVEGTRALLKACKAAGVKNMLHVSTIAAGYADQRFYPYAQSKAAAEEIVRKSSLSFAILRPTIVIGNESPIWQSLSKIAKLPLIPLPQSGGVASVQPIHVDDVARAIECVLSSDRFEGEVLELGGPQSMAMSEFLTAIRVATDNKAPTIIPIPLAPIQYALAMVEPIARSFMPITAGQLTVFGNDSTASPNWLMERLRDSMASTDETIGRLIDEAETAQHGEPQLDRTDVHTLTDDLKRSLRAECDAFSRYLANDIPGERLKAHYAEAARAHGLAFKEDFTCFDRATLTLASKHKTLARWADAYCALFHRRGALRRKLILLSALLEHTAPSNQVFDHTEGRGALRAVASLALHGASFAVSLVMGALILLPIGVICLSSAMLSGQSVNTRPAA